MFSPKFNSVLVEIDNKDGEWGGSGDDTVLGKSFHKGKLIKIGERLTTQANPISEQDSVRIAEMLSDTKGKTIIWNEGDEAGTTFEYEGKLYGFVYYWNIRGVRE